MPEFMSKRESPLVPSQFAVKPDDCSIVILKAPSVASRRIGCADFDAKVLDELFGSRWKMGCSVRLDVIERNHRLESAFDAKQIIHVG